MPWAMCFWAFSPITPTPNGLKAISARMSAQDCLRWTISSKLKVSKL